MRADPALTIEDTCVTSLCRIAIDSMFSTNIFSISSGGRSPASNSTKRRGVFISGNKSTLSRSYDILPNSKIANTIILIVTGFFNANLTIFLIYYVILKVQLFYRSGYFNTLTRLFSRKVSYPLTIRLSFSFSPSVTSM
ncbi:hypothetical protein SDC9_151316 [bioreactor metagenome]|uniref:Uncharacterized protein n=1 Tax=bioreactor metagenome TaxID=1076179 RepID=A0A645ERQ7_9ZZZZ